MLAAPTTSRPKRTIQSWLSAAASADGTADPIDYGDVAYAHGNLYVNPEGTWATYSLGEIDGDNRPVSELEGHADDAAHRYADLTGHTTRMWGIPMEFPREEFRARMRAEYPNGIPDGDADTSSFDDQLDRKVGYIAALDARRVVPVVAVRITTERIKREHLPHLTSDIPLPPPLGGVDKVRALARRITRSVSRSGFAAQPLTEEELVWAIRSTRAPGLPAPHVRFGRWGGVSSMSGFGDAVTATASPDGSPYTVVTGVRHGKAVTAYVAVLRASIPERFNLAERLPWLGWFDSLGPEDVEHEGHWRAQWAMTMALQSGRDAAGDIAWHRRLIDSVARHYLDHDSDDDTQMAHLKGQAVDSYTEAQHGDPSVATRAHGQLFVIVSADTPERLQAAVESVTDSAASEQGMTLHHEQGQWADYRRAIVGNRWDVHGHVIHPRVSYLAAALPTLSPAAGDPTGVVFGNPAGSNTAYVFNALHGRENGKAGVGVFASAQGGGKTATAVMIADDLCQSGIRGTAFTPDGQITQILNARHYQGGRGRTIPLTQVTTPGVAMPSLMVPPPLRNPGETDEDYRARVDEANSSRIRYERDWLTSVLPGDMQRGGMGVSVAIENAVAKGGGLYGISPWEHVARLREDGSDVARAVADVLETRSSLPTGRLGFPRKGEDDHDTVQARIRGLMESDALFTCITLPGVQLAQSPDKGSWRDEHFDAEPVLMAGLRLSSLALFSDRDPGWFIADEVDIATGGATAFTPFLLNLIYDVRRYGKWVALLVKSMSTLRDLDEHVTSLLGWAALGRMGAEGAQACLPLLGAHVDPAVAETVPALDDGEWYFRGWDDKVRRIPFDQAWWHPDVIEGTNTKQGARPERLASAIRSW